LIVVIGAAAISFALIHVTGNPAEVLAAGLLPPEQVAQFAHKLGYDRPFFTQLTGYLLNVLHGDFGSSIRYRQPAMRVVMDALPYTAALVGVAIVGATSVALPISVLSIRGRDRLADKLIRGMLLVLQGVPEFWLGMLLVLLFALQLRLLPSMGAASVVSIILPACAIALPLMSTFVRILRNEMLQVMDSDLTVALRAKGLTEREIIWRHAIPNAAAPFLAIVALQTGSLLGGTLVVESMFAWPGIGNLEIDAVRTRDIPVLQAIVVTIAVCYVLLNLAVDLVTAAIDPRLRRRQQ
jgi:peptide/nickel transport system permease protein